MSSGAWGPWVSSFFFITLHNVKADMWYALWWVPVLRLDHHEITNEMLKVHFVIFCLSYWRINQLIWEKFRSRALSWLVLVHMHCEDTRLWYWKNIWHCHFIERIRLYDLDQQNKNAAALCDDSLEGAPVRPTGSSVRCCSDEGAGCDSHAHRLQNNWDIARCIFLVWNGSMLFVWQRWTITAHSAPVTSPNLSENTSKNTLLFSAFSIKTASFLKSRL